MGSFEAGDFSFMFLLYESMTENVMLSGLQLIYNCSHKRNAVNTVSQGSALQKLI